MPHPTPPPRRAHPLWSKKGKYVAATLAFGFLMAVSSGGAEDSRLLRPLSITEALDIALQQNSAIQKSQADLKATHGIVLQARAIALPKVNVSSQYGANESSSIDRFR